MGQTGFACVVYPRGVHETQREREVHESDLQECASVNHQGRRPSRTRSDQDFEQAERAQEIEGVTETSLSINSDE
jgi:hypothetical protein